MHAIVRRFGSEERFDVFVQTELPPLLAEGKRRYHRLLPTMFLENLQHVAGD